MNSIFKALELSQEISNKMDPSSFILALILSLISALAASGLYQYFYENRGTGSQVNRSFPLLGISITTLFLGVQMSLPLSLGLLGALSIVRFRTPIREPEEVGFIMLVIAASITCATFNFQLLMILYLMAVLTLVMTRGKEMWKHKSRDGLLIFSMPQDKAVIDLKAITSYLGGQTSRHTMESTSSKEGMTSVHFSFTGLKKQAAEIHADIKALSQIQTFHVFFHRPGGIR